MVEFLHARRWEKWNRTCISWRVVKVCVGIIWHGGIGIFCFLTPKFIKILNFIKSLCVIFLLSWFNYCDQKLRQFSFINTLIPIYTMSQRAKCFNTPMSDTTHHCKFDLCQIIWYKFWQNITFKNHVID